MLPTPEGKPNGKEPCLPGAIEQRIKLDLGRATECRVVNVDDAEGVIGGEWADGLTADMILAAVNNERSRQHRDLDLLLYGNHFTDADGNRIDPRDVLIIDGVGRGPDGRKVESAEMLPRSKSPYGRSMIEATLPHMFNTQKMQEAARDYMLSRVRWPEDEKIIHLSMGTGDEADRPADSDGAGPADGA